MQNSAAQLDMFEIPPVQVQESIATCVEVDSRPMLEIVGDQEEDDEMPSEVPAILCLSPSAGIGECRDCWEKHPALWPRYTTRANCVKHTR